MNLFWLKNKAKLKGLFQGSIPYLPLLQNGDSSPYFGNYEGQKYGPWDTDTCWNFAFTEIMETRLTMLRAMNLIPADTLAWLNANGYVDKDGDFYLSRRWEGILSGVKDNGNFQAQGYLIASQAGLIPNSMLPFNYSGTYTDATRAQFVADYFNPAVITPAMKAMGQEFLKRFTIMGEMLDPTLANMVTYLHEGSMQIGTPAQAPGWNNQKVDRPVGDNNADHSTELYKVDFSQAYPYYDYDSYQPNLKQLSKDYPIILLTRLYIYPKTVAQPLPLPQFSTWMQIWFNIKAWLTGQPLPYPSVPVGSA